MDETLLVKVRKGIEFYYFGKGCLADYHSNNISFLDAIEISIVTNATGIHTVKEIIVIAQKETGASVEVIAEHLKKLIDKGIIIARRNLSINEVIFHGEFGFYYPKELIIELTNQCNFTCPFCYKNAGAKGVFISDEMVSEINRSIYKKINHIQLTGGEPTLHPSFEKYVHMFSEYANVSIVTNGSCLYNYDNEVIRKLDMIQFSLYGNNNQEYQSNTGMEEGFTHLMKSIEMVKKSGTNFSVSATLYEGNIDKVEEYVLTAIKLGAPVIKLGAADLFGREKRQSALNPEYIQKKKELDEKLIYLKRKYLGRINVILNNIEADESNDEFKRKIYEGFLKCGAGIDYLVISQNGNIRPCLYFSEKDFYYGSIDAFKTFIKGDFHKEKLKSAVNKMFNQGFYKDNEISPCWAIKQYYEQYKSI